MSVIQTTSVMYALSTINICRINVRRKEQWKERKGREEEGRRWGTEKGRKEKKEKRLEPLQTFAYFRLSPPLPSWDFLLWSCPGARARINILAIQATSSQQALSFEQCASSGWMPIDDDHGSKWSCPCFKVHFHKLKTGMPRYSRQTRWSEEVRASVGNCRFPKVHLWVQTKMPLKLTW